MSEWRINGIEDDVRPRMFALARAGQAFALATIAAAEGGPRPVGSQMVATGQASWGFLSGGCIEDDVVRHGRAVLADGQSRLLIYGRGSPFIDIRLPCGGRIEVLVERIAGNDRALQTLETLTTARRAAMWCSNGQLRLCAPAEGAETLADAVVRRRYTPNQRLLVVGTDPIALALAGLGTAMGWETRLLAPFGPAGPAPLGVECDRRPLSQSLSPASLDPWTAICVATHDMDADEAALVAGLASDAGFVGVLGSRRKLAEREQRLADAGLSVAQVKRLHAPIGLDIGARSSWDVAVSVVAQIIQERERTAASECSPELATTRCVAA